MASIALPLAVYGTLRPGGGALERLGIADRMTRIGPCVLRGMLHDFGTYPGFVEGDGFVVGDLFEMPDAATLEILDHWERYDPTRRDEGWYRRSVVRLIEPDCEAVTYIYNRPLGGAPVIEGGDWLTGKRAHV